MTDTPIVQAPPKKRRWGKMLLIVLIVLAIPVFYLFFKPLRTEGLTRSGKAVQSYAEALERAKGLDVKEMGRLSPVGETVLLTHGKQTEWAVVLLHGYTKSPHEFLTLGQMLYGKGYNVLLPRLPHHGLADRMSTDQAALTAEEITMFANEAVDVAHGLGRHVLVAGLSAGGLTTSWIAQTRADVDAAVIMSPVFGYKQVPTPVTRPVMNAYLTLPNSFKWWDEKLKEQVQPTFYYPRWSTHALAQLLRLSFAIQERAASEEPAARRILMITNANDASVNNEMTASVVANWSKHAPQKIHAFEFPASQGLDHDFIDPDMPHQQTQTVYPQLLDLITKQMASER